MKKSTRQTTAPIAHALRGKRGTSLISAALLSFAILMITCVAMEYFRLTIIASGIRDAVQSAVIAASIDNYADVYAPVREGYTSGQIYDSVSSSFKPTVSVGDVYGRLDNLLGLKIEGNDHVKYADSTLEYTLSDLQVSVTNTPLAPSNGSGGSARMFKADASIRFVVPLSFGWQTLPPLSINLTCKAGWREKF